MHAYIHAHIQTHKFFFVLCTHTNTQILFRLVGQVFALNTLHKQRSFTVVYTFRSISFNRTAEQLVLLLAPNFLNNVREILKLNLGHFKQVKFDEINTMLESTAVPNTASETGNFLFLVVGEASVDL